ncbi:hypothetical protein OKA05_03350 [Luteolibacter arcticus]|uniref:Lipoprotein n=1 Tax=Luteolibacter arcticus TaxID=1581411 RepID=A0ABT3GDE5_9BACT|nr:hypothetical protein [Luteolibacter arcticus]MCW1921574.1 hypothetical protein [Luteolibacter arcticus]
MNLRLILPATAAILLAASCTPYTEPPPEEPTDPAQRKPTPEEQEKIRQQREEQKKKDAENQSPDKEKKPEGETTGGTPGELPKNDGGAGDGGGAEKPAAPQKEIPVARPVPGKPGMVFSPFNNKVIDVKGIPSGRLVADPTYPASEKKHFRVP